MTKTRIYKLSAARIKWMALVFMTLDHTGMLLFPDTLWFRCVGRLAFPLYAWLMAEGCRYSSRPWKRTVRLALTAVLCQSVLTFFTGSHALNVLVTFTVSSVLCGMIRTREHNPTGHQWIPAAGILVIMLGMYALQCAGWPCEYGIPGILLPVILFLSGTGKTGLAIMAVYLVGMSLTVGGLQWWSLFSLIPLYMYDGTKGNLWLPQWFFYLYYPLHILALALLSLIK